MSGISTGTALVIGAGLTAGTAIYSADKGKDQARRLLGQQEALAQQEEARIRDQMAQQEQAAKEALAQQERQIAMAAAESERLAQNERNRAAADVAAQEAARQTEAAGAQVDVAGAKPESRNKRRKAFFNPDGGAGAAGGGFRV